MDEKIREVLKDLNSRFAGKLPYLIEAADPKQLRLSEKNARYMTNEMFQNLVDNIRKDGGLSSMPLCLKEADGGLRVLSGNHRVMAASKAGLEVIIVMVIDKELTRDEMVAIQLSHNAIAGKDDQALLKELWDEIQNIELKVYAGLDTETVKKLESMQFDTIAEARLDFKTVTFLFLPEEVQHLNEVIEKADGIFTADSIYLLSRKHFDKLFEVVVKTKEGYNIVNNPTALMKILELANERMERG